MELYDYIMQPETVSRPDRQQFNHAHPLGHYYQDRYPYQTPDTNLWLALFWMVDPVDRRLAEVLEYIRAVGAYLTPDPQYGYRIQPIIGPNGWASMNEYNQEREYLMPHIQTMLQALGDLRRRYDAGQIR